MRSFDASPSFVLPSLLRSYTSSSGKWNGFGGKVEPGETIEAAAIRELQEEACLAAEHVKMRGKITFTFLTLPDILVSNP